MAELPGVKPSDVAPIKHYSVTATHTPAFAGPATTPHTPRACSRLPHAGPAQARHDSGPAEA